MKKMDCCGSIINEAIIREGLVRLFPVEPPYIRMAPNQWRDWVEVTIQPIKLPPVGELRKTSDGIGPARLIIDSDLNPTVIRFEDDHGNILLRMFNLANTAVKA